MILYSTLATIAAVARGLAVNALRAQVRGLAKELNKKTHQSEKQNVQIWDLTAEINGEKDKAKTWEKRAEVAERDLRSALDSLFVATNRLTTIKERARLRKQRYRAKKKANNV